MMANKEIPFDRKVVEAEENLLIDYQFLLQERMTQKGISQSRLAELAGISKARLSQILSDGANPTVKTFAGLFFALGESVSVSSVPLEFEKALSQETSLLQEWHWAQPVRMAEPINEQMVALMKSSAMAVVESSSTASNDNYGGARVIRMESEFAAALALENEAESLENEAA
jgi:transcriptional regulator with XRE-family HTH domain